MAAVSHTAPLRGGDAPAPADPPPADAAASTVRAVVNALLPAGHKLAPSLSASLTGGAHSAPAPPAPSVPGAFHLSISGSIQTAQFPGESVLFCTYSFTHGPDWTLVQGVDTAVSQLTHPDASGEFVWNLPIEVTFKSTNPFGWPRLVVTVVSRDFFHRFVARGYGSVLVPTVSGTSVKSIHTFAPVTSSMLQQLSALVRGHAPQFYDSKFVAKSEGREATRVRSSGSVTVTFNTLSRGISAHGYSVKA